MSTGNPRNKVCLAPGRSLMDWVRLSNSGADLSGTGGRKRTVTPAELAEHCVRTDVWMALRGQVYNVTRYLEYHPGGADELMRGAGTDATDLFNQTHRWVNFYGMLKACVVGRYAGPLPAADAVVRGKSARMLAPPSGAVSAPGLLAPPADAVSAPGLLAPPAGDVSVPRPVTLTVAAAPDSSDSDAPTLEWRQSTTSVHLTIQFSPAVLPKPHQLTRDDVYVCLLEDCRVLRMYVYLPERVFDVHWRLSAAVCAGGSDQHDWRINVHDCLSRLELTLQKQKVDVVDDWQQDGFGTALAGHGSLHWRAEFNPIADEAAVFVDCKLVERWRASESADTWLLVLQPPDTCALLVPLGCHVHVRCGHVSTELVKPYTPVTARLYDDEPSDCRLHLLVKVYDDGALTPLLAALPVGDTLQVSAPAGLHCADPSQLQLPRRRLLALAAGSGLTPMVRLVRRTLGGTAADVRLAFFNRREQDIIWRDQLEELASRQSRFQVLHVLSAADERWSGRRGRVSTDLVEALLPDSGDVDVLTEDQLKVAVCGPSGFITACKTILHQLNVPQSCWIICDG